MNKRPSVSDIKETTGKSTEIAVLKVLAYFNLFKHPLNTQEIQYCLPNKLGELNLTRVLDEMVRTRKITNYKGYFFLDGDSKIVDKREEGMAKADKYFRKAYRVSRIISQFPFVRGIYISGSLSKGVINEKGDVDYFVVTKANRLWLVKGVLALIKKLFLLNSKKYFCFNYFIDDKHLKIEDENIFTAVELAHLKPVYNNGLHHKMIRENPWIYTYLPNAEFRSHNCCFERKDSRFKKSIEFLLGGWVGEITDTISMKLFESFWKLKYGGMVRDNKDVRIRCKKHVSKIHPNNFQEKVLSALEDEYKRLERELDVELAH